MAARELRTRLDERTDLAVTDMRVILGTSELPSLTADEDLNTIDKIGAVTRFRAIKGKGRFTSPGTGIIQSPGFNDAVPISEIEVTIGVLAPSDVETHQFRCSMASDWLQIYLPPIDWEPLPEAVRRGEAGSLSLTLATAALRQSGNPVLYLKSEAGDDRAIVRGRVTNLFWETQCTIRKEPARVNPAGLNLPILGTKAWLGLLGVVALLSWLVRH